MCRRFSIILMLVMVLLMAASSRGLCKTIAQLRKDLVAKFEKFDKHVKDMTVETETTMSQGERGMVVLKSKILRKGLKMRIENTVKIDTGEAQAQEMTSTMVYDGENAWMINPLGQAIKIEDIPQEHMDPTRFIPEGALITGEGKVDGRLCHVISYIESQTSYVNPESPMEYKLWLDKERLIPLKMEMGDVVLLFKDYKKIAGMWGVPYKTLITGGPQEAVFYVKNVKVNTGLSDKLFKVEATESKSLKEMMKMYE